MTEFAPWMDGPVGAVLWAVLGLVGGSFASMLSHRLPLGTNVTTDRSRCPHCGHPLAARDLVPLFSWLLQQARCRYCQARISWRYPAIELSTSLLFVAAWWRGDDIIGTALLALTGLAMVVIIVADLEAGIVPDPVLLALLPVALAWQWRQGGHWLDAGLGFIAGPALLLPVRAIFRRIKGRQGLGLGDVKMIMVAGIFVGLTGLPNFLVIGGILGLIFGVGWRISGRGSVFPFAPALAVAFLLCLFLPSVLVLPPITAS